MRPATPMTGEKEMKMGKKKQSEQERMRQVALQATFDAAIQRLVEEQWAQMPNPTRFYKHATFEQISHDCLTLGLDPTNPPDHLLERVRSFLSSDDEFFHRLEGALKSLSERGVLVVDECTRTGPRTMREALDLAAKEKPDGLLLLVEGPRWGNPSFDYAAYGNRLTADEVEALVLDVARAAGLPAERRGDLIVIDDPTPYPDDEVNTAEENEPSGDVTSAQM